MSNMHEFYLRKTLQLAAKGHGKVSPNPLVGAIIVKKGRIIGEGWHEKFGQEHAEINALRKCLDNQKNSDLYINLEPCCHVGKTPPCTAAIIKSGIKRVFFCVRDPNPLMKGKSISILKSAGIQVFSGFLEKEASKLNEQFLKHIICKKPFIALKIAMTLDGKIALKSGNSKWITSERSRIHIHRLRHQYDSVLIGINTVITDDPHLGVRHIKGRDPRRIILDPWLKINTDSRVLRDSNTIICCQKKEKLSLASQNIYTTLEEKGISFIECDKHINLHDISKDLYNKKIYSVLVEGGKYTFTEFVKQNAYDKIYVCIAPKLLGESKSLSAFGDLEINELANAVKLKYESIKKMGEDLMIVAYPK